MESSSPTFCQQWEKRQRKPCEIFRHERLKIDKNPYKDKEYFLIKKERRKNAKKVVYKETAAFKSRLTLMKDLKVKNA
jgi:hypothetical protein